MAERSRHECVSEMFEAQAERTPDAVALVHGPEALTYRELDRRAAALAHLLRDRGVGPEVTVGLGIERSIDLLVAVLATLETGGAFLALDPAMPDAQLAWMIESSGAAMVLTTRALASRFTSRARVIRLDADLEPPPHRPDAGTRRRLDPESQAYVVYTSGSTGQPKGISMPRRAMINTVEWENRRPGLPAGARTLQFASPAFDVFHQETFATWCSGGALVVLPEALKRDPARLLAFIEEHQVHRLYLPTAALAPLAKVAAAVRRAPGCLRIVIVAGERLQITGAIRSFFERLSPGAILVNQYGTSEIDLGTELVLPGAPAAWPDFPAIGLPISGVTARVLGPDLRPVTDGAPGELYVGGVAVARGYAGRPDLTSGWFLPDPCAAEPGARLYRTGDLASRLADGSIELHGRVDDQLKIRGYRVEPAEIEVALASHPDVREAAVVGREDVPGEGQLVAYLVPSGSRAPALEELRDFLARRLPEYLVPAAFMVLDALPLMSHGSKVDRRALPPPDHRRLRPRSSGAPPQGDLERLLASAFAEALKVEPISRDDDFFALGGSSILAMEMLGKLEERLGAALPPVSLMAAPTVAALAARIAPVLQAASGPAVPAIRRGGGAGALAPLSPGQEQLWLHEQLLPEEGPSVYNETAGLWLTGRLAPECLRRALEEVMRRHEALRAGIVEVEGRPMQRIAPPRPLELEQVSLEELDPAARDQALQRGVAGAVRRRFDLAGGALMRASLFRLEEERHLLLLVVHHLVFDDWSFTVLIRELGALYRAMVEGAASPLGDLPIQYADFARWQRERLQGTRLEELLSYWREKLAGVPPLELLPDHPRPAVQTFRGGAAPLAVGPESARALERLSREQGVSLFVTVLAAFQVLLLRYTGQEDFAVGVPFAQRDRPETHGLIGYFVNMLALRGDLSGDPTFLELLRRTRQVARDAFEHHQAPFERVVAALPRAADPGRPPVFQVTLALQEPSVSVEAEGLSFSEAELPAAVAKVDLSLALLAAPQGWSGRLEYNADLFEPQTATRMARNLEVLLQGIASNPGRRLSELPLLSEADRQPAGWSDTRRSFLEDVCLHHLFEAQVTRHPEALAVKLGEEQLTYAELDARANQLAYHLRELGVGPERIVAICLERSVGMAVAILGTLKAGGAYLPLDTALPAQRLRVLLDEARPQALIASKRTVPLIGERGEPKVDLDEDRPRLERHGAQSLGVRVVPEDVACVLYTSGSTGTPKGVLLRHCSLVNYMTATIEALGLGPGDRLLQIASSSFDVAQADVHLSLGSGAALVLVPEVPAPGAELQRAIEVEQITIINSPTVYWHEWIAELSRTGGVVPAPLRAIYAGGEAASSARYARWVQAAGNTRLINIYGPAETTIGSSTFEPPRGWSATTPSLPIGQPIANTRFHVLDERMRPVPRGAAGELYIGGVGLARGYLHSPDRTAASFVPDPSGTEPGARLYGTGDRVRLRWNDEIEFIGRRDHQVKLRGYRVELGEVEAALRRHPVVHEAVAVVAGAPGSGDRRLIAFAVPRPQAAIQAEELRAFLRASLPDYMVPAAIALLDRMPLTPGGKRDRRKLATLAEEVRPATGALAPRSPLERGIAEVFARVLGLDRVGVDDSFFELGGHSLLGARLLSELRERFGVTLRLRALFENPTVASLARVVEQSAGPSPGTSRIPRRADLRELPLSLFQERILRWHQMAPECTFWHVSEALLLTGRLDVEALQRSLDEVVHRHALLRARYSIQDGAWTQRIDEAIGIPLDRFDLSQEPPEVRRVKLERLAVDRALAPFDLARGPITRFILVRTAPDEHHLWVVVHHASFDGTSVANFLEELRVLYPAHLAGARPALPELPVDYADFAAWYRRVLEGPAGEAQAAFWKRNLEGARPVELPVRPGRARPAQFSSRPGQVARWDASEALLERLRALARAERATLHMATLAGYVAALALETGQEDVCVFSPYAHRDRAETAGLFGYLANPILLRTRLSGALTLRELLSRVKDTVLDAYAHPHFPVLELRPEMYRVSFNYLPRYDLPSLPGLQVAETQALSAGTTRFELVCFAAERSNGLGADLFYDADLLEPAMVRRLAARYSTLLELLAEDPALTLDAAFAAARQRP